MKSHPDWQGYDPDAKERAEVTYKEADEIFLYKNKTKHEAPKVWKYDMGYHR